MAVAKAFFMHIFTQPDALKAIPRPQVIREQLARCTREVDLLRRLLKLSELAARELASTRNRRAEVEESSGEPEHFERHLAARGDA
jgi:hypothetical protein